MISIVQIYNKPVITRLHCPCKKVISITHFDIFVLFLCMNCMNLLYIMLVYMYYDIMHNILCMYSDYSVNGTLCKSLLLSFPSESCVI